MAKKKKYSIYHATEFHEKRPKRSKGADESRTAKNTKNYPTKAWYDDPNKSDIRNIDTKKSKAKNIKEVIRFLKGVKDIPDKNIKFTSQKKAIITYHYSVNVLRKAINVRYNNVRVFKRVKKGRTHDFWISVLKK